MEARVATLQGCLTAFTAPETLRDRDAFACSECARRVGAGTGQQRPLSPAVKQLLLAAVPPFLILHLKRFCQTARGLRKVKAATSPSRCSWTWRPSLYPPPPPSASSPALPATYRLNGLVVHSGGMGGGHYTAYVRRVPPDGAEAWFYFSDASWHQVQATEVLRTGGLPALLCARPAATATVR